MAPRVQKTAPDFPFPSIITNSAAFCKWFFRSFRKTSFVKNPLLSAEDSGFPVPRHSSRPVRNAASDAASATAISGRPKNARQSAAAVPAAAVRTLPVL